MRGQTVEEQAQREEYVRRVLEAYRQTPGTTGRVHQPDRLLAAQLYQRGVPLETVQNALLLAAARRLFRSPDASSLATVRSLAYFVPAIEEVLELKISPDYFRYVRNKLHRFYVT